MSENEAAADQRICQLCDRGGGLIATAGRGQTDGVPVHLDCWMREQATND